MAHGIRVVPGPAKPADPTLTAEARRVSHLLAAMVLVTLAALVVTLAAAGAPVLALVVVAGLGVLAAFAREALGLVRRLGRTR
jgi:hypothetical protein